MDEKKIRINKYIADAGICSRRDADKLVEQGLVMVNGRLAESGSIPEESVHISACRGDLRKSL